MPLATEIVSRPLDAAPVAFAFKNFRIDRRNATFALPFLEGGFAGKRTTIARRAGGLEDLKNGLFAAKLFENGKHADRIQKISCQSIQKVSYFFKGESICSRSMKEKDKIALDAKDISDRIKLRMRELKMSHETLADRLGLSEPGVKKLLGGGSSVQYLKLRRIAEALDTTPNYLLSVEDGSSLSAKRSRAILEVALAAALQTVGELDAEHAQQLARSVLAIPDRPAIVSAGLDEETAARARAEIAAQEYLSPKN